MNESLFQTRRQRREQADVKKTALVVMSRLGGLCYDLQNMKLLPLWPAEKKGRLGQFADIAKECRQMAEMYVKNDVFTPEISYEEGYNATANFEKDPANARHMEFPEMLNEMAEILDDFDQVASGQIELDDDVRDAMTKDIALLTKYLYLLKKYTYMFYIDYDLADIDRGGRLAMKKEWIDWMPEWGLEF